MNKKHDVIELVADDLVDVELPGRYVGGEFGRYKESAPGMLSVGICFPDLYEIGMSNQAVKILYDLVNRTEGCFAQRVFAPAPDFSRVLRTKDIPLFTLEDHIPLNSLDVLAVSVGYELLSTNVLSVLDLGAIPLHSQLRSDSHPIVLAGGPGITNPAPLSAFIDAWYIGEAEESFPRLLQIIAKMNQEHASRKQILHALSLEDCIYVPGKQRAVGSLFHGFSRNQGTFEYFTVPSIKVVQDHGVAEIMRGCPNGCRFCHAGMLYRPFRQIGAEVLFGKVDHAIFTQGYDSVTLSSLSTGDYPGLPETVKGLDLAFGEGHVSFALPSLKIDTFTLDVLEQVSKVRKSGLTFAVETPTDFGQAALNKMVSREKVLDILLQAKKRGWKLAKFYFMIGLPGSDSSNIAEQIIEYISYVEKESRINLNVNIGTFIPKPHTPFQWARQLSEDEALAIFRTIKDAFRKNRFVKVSYHDTFVSMLEGIISRGDERVGQLIEKAYRNGAVLDAWDDHLRKDIWQEVFSNAGWNVLEILEARDIGDSLPWDCIDTGVTNQFLAKEYKKALSGELSDICEVSCSHPCGACRKAVKPEVTDGNDSQIARLIEAYRNRHLKYYESTAEEPCKVLIKFTKTGTARFLSHINIMKVFERSFRRMEIPVSHSQGFNPKPKIDFAHPLSLGVSSNAEYLLFQTPMDKEELEKRLRELSGALPEGIACLDVKYVDKPGKFSLMAQYGGAEYELHAQDIEELEKLFQAHDHVRILKQAAGTVRIRIDMTTNAVDLFKITDDKYEFIKKYRPVRTETLCKEGVPMNQASFLA